MDVDKAIFSPVESKRTFEEISSNIKALIIEGVLKPGDRLPSETELAKQFQVGRQTIRESLRILELSGFVQVQKGFGGGPIIKDTILGKVTNLLLDAFKMEKIAASEFVEARSVIEKAIVNYAIDHAQADDIAALQDSIMKAKSNIENKSLATDINFEFHSILAKASGNNVFVILEGAINAIHRLLRDESAVDLESSKKAVEAHEKILDALIKKDRETAIALTEKHILTIGKTLNNHLE